MPRAAFAFALVFAFAATACGEAPMMIEPAPAVPAAFVTVNAYNRTVNDARVIYHGADGRVLISKEGASTKGPIESAGMITWIESAEPPYQMYTIAGVEPFDKLAFKLLGDYLYFAGETRVRMPGPMPGVPFYSVENECDFLNVDDPSPDLEHVLFAHSVCLRLNRETVVAFAVDEAGERLAYSAKGLYLPESYMAEVTLDPWRTDLQRFEVSVNSVPADAVRMHGQLAVIRNRRYLAQQTLHPAVANNVTLHFQQPPSLGESIIFASAAYVPSGFRGAGPYFGEAALLPLTMARGEIDFAELGLPRITARTVEGSAISWTIDAGPSAADWIELEIAWPDGIWLIILPPNATRFAFPAFPEELAAVVPTSGEFNVNVVVQIDDAHYDGYASLKRDGSFPPSNSYDLDEYTRLRFSGF